MSSHYLNKVTLMGHIGNDPDLRFQPATGGRVVTIRLATHESYQDKSSRQQIRTEWHRVVFFNRLADQALERLHKGLKIYIEGSLRTQEWTRNGEKCFSTEIIAKDLKIFDELPESTQSTRKAFPKAVHDALSEDVPFH